MIKIYDMNEVRDQDIFLRHDAVKDVSQPVAEIIRRVRKRGTPPSTTTLGNLTRWS